MLTAAPPCGSEAAVYDACAVQRESTSDPLTVLTTAPAILYCSTTVIFCAVSMEQRWGLASRIRLAGCGHFL